MGLIAKAIKEAIKATEYSTYIADYLYIRQWKCTCICPEEMCLFLPQPELGKA